MVTSLLALDKVTGGRVCGSPYKSWNMGNRNHQRVFLRLIVGSKLFDRIFCYFIFPTSQIRSLISLYNQAGWRIWQNHGVLSAQVYLLSLMSPGPEKYLVHMSLIVAAHLVQLWQICRRGSLVVLSPYILLLTASVVDDFIVGLASLDVEEVFCSGHFI